MYVEFSVVWVQCSTSHTFYVTALTHKCRIVTIQFRMCLLTIVEHHCATVNSSREDKCMQLSIILWHVQLTFTRGWAPRPFSISFTSAGAVSIAEKVSTIAGVVGCWSNCGVSEFHLTIHWIIQTATINSCIVQIKKIVSYVLTMYWSGIIFACLTHTTWVKAKKHMKTNLLSST